MSKGQLAEAQRLTRRWKPSRPNSKNTKSTPKKKASVAVKSSGTGFYISNDGHVLTNFHVIQACKSQSIRTPSGSSAPATVITKDNRDDLALLKTTKKPRSVAIFRAGASPRIGERVVVYGFPLTNILASSGNLVTGNLSALAGVGNDPRHYQITAPIQPGNSGGPLLDESGRVIGVIVSKLNAARVAKAIGDIPQNVNFAIKGSTALGFVEAGGVEPIFQIKKDKQSPAVIAQKAQEFTVQVLCQK
jgi:serine protease Do